MWVDAYILTDAVIFIYKVWNSFLIPQENVKGVKF